MTQGDRIERRMRCDICGHEITVQVKHDAQPFVICHRCDRVFSYVREAKA